MTTTPPSTPPLTGTLIGYARVSSVEQSLDLQQDALKAAGCIQIFQDKISGAKADRPGLDLALAYLRPGDTLVVWRLDRLGRSLKHLIQTVETLQDRGVGFRSLQEAIDTTTSGGRLVFQIFGALAEFERSLIRERTMAGLEAARARGRNGGRRKKLSPAQQDLLFQLYDSKQHTVSHICKLLGLSRSALYGYLQERKCQGPGMSCLS
jgi:DNA invertase Pin-like site-specific DNA recombinase